MSSTNIQIIKNGVQVQGFESGGIVLDVQGTQGQLFSITDSLTGDLFKVSDISGIPIFNINSSGSITIDGDLILDSSTATATSGDYLIISDLSNSSRLTKGPLIGTDSSTYLRNDGTWATPAGTYSHPTQTAIDVNATDNGVNVIDRVVVNTLGHVTSVATRDLSAATTSAPGVMSAVDKIKLDGIATNANNYTLPIASATLGGVKSGTAITVDDSGNVSVNNNSHSHTSSNISDATNANTANVIVKRDGSGNFSAGTITANLTGTATSATNSDTVDSFHMSSGMAYKGSYTTTITRNATDTTYYVRILAGYQSNQLLKLRIEGSWSNIAGYVYVEIHPYAYMSSIPVRLYGQGYNGFNIQEIQVRQNATSGHLHDIWIKCFISAIGSAPNTGDGVLVVYGTDVLSLETATTTAPTTTLQSSVTTSESLVSNKGFTGVLYGNATTATTATTANALNTSNAYTGTSFNSITGLSSTNPLMNGTEAVGTSTLVSRQDHVHGSDTTKANTGGGNASGTWPIGITGNAATATTATNAYGLLASSDKNHFLGESSNWNAVGFSNLTNLHFQGHNQFWVGAGNGTWFTGAANTKTQTSGLAANATEAHDLLITTMQSDINTSRGIVFAVDNTGGGTSGWRLGKWHSGDAADSSKLVVDGGLFVKGAYTDEYDYYTDDYSAYYSEPGGRPGWISGSMNRASITASTALQIQSGNNGNNTRKPQLQFHQCGYGGPTIEYDGPNKVLRIWDASGGDYFNKLTVDGTIAFGPDTTNTGKAEMVYNPTENSIDFIIN